MWTPGKPLTEELFFSDPRLDGTLAYFLWGSPAGDFVLLMLIGRNFFEPPEPIFQ